MAADDSPDRYLAERQRVRRARAAQILQLAAHENARRILEYGLSHPVFELARAASSLGLTVSRLYPSMGRMIKLGMITKRHAAHTVVVYELTYDGKLVATCLRQLGAEFKTKAPNPGRVERRGIEFDDGHEKSER